MRFESVNFSCEQCGATLIYSPVTNSLSCEFCSSTEAIPLSNNTIEEYDFYKTLQSLGTHKIEETTKEVKCSKCAVTFELSPYVVSSSCPYCGTPAITDFVKDITPKSILPFTITEIMAIEKFKKWIGSLWFAPSKLKKIANGENKLKGYYLPHWTYDSQTYSKYSGERGTIYYVTVEKTVIENGRERQVQEREARIRWTPVSGAISNSFNDVTVGASKTISHSILESLEPWDTTKLVPFNKKYLSGFESEEYTIGLKSGFKFAKIKMDIVIRRDIIADIGGDQQRIHHVNTKHSNTTYKNALFPVWIAKFNWKNKIYNYAINGQSGEVRGERPYSIIKIVLLVGVILTLIGVAFYFKDGFMVSH